MEPFNIKIVVNHDQVSLTILPTAEGSFKIVYYAGILGEIRYIKESNTWEPVPEDQRTVSDLPPYQHVENDNRLEITFDAAIVSQVGHEIENVKLGLGQTDANA